MRAVLLSEAQARRIPVASARLLNNQQPYQRVHVTPRHTLHKYRAVHEHLFHLFFLRVSSRADKLE